MLSGTETLRCAIALSLMKGINRPAVEHLLHRCGDLTALFGETPESWRKILGITAPLFDAEARQKALAAADAEMRFIDKEGITPIFFTDSDYPARLLECPDAPLMLYFKGNGSLNPPRTISIVGTRRATRYGRDFCAALLRDLAESVPDLTIVSGMAYGIDICAHREALKNGLSTIGVLAHGLHTLYPAVHRDTAREALGTAGITFSTNSAHTPTHMNYHSLARTKANRHMEPFIIDIAPITVDDHELSSHEGEEFILVTEGCVEITYGNRSYILRQGESIYYDSIVPHHVHAYGNRAARVLAVVYVPA